MRGLMAVVIALLFFGVAVWCVAGSKDYAAGSTAAASTQPVGVAVVELFTSEGCSSCPPAEKVLARLVDSARSDGRPIYTLAFHVDYWNHLGWSDSFSDAAYSQRQNEYSKSFGSSQVYTPQMIVNGKDEFVGSDSKTADEKIAKALATRAEAAVAVKVDRITDGGFKIHATVNGAGVKDVVNIAVVEQGISTQINSGENRGRKIEEPSIVRWFKTVPLSGAGEVTVPMLPKVHLDHASVIVYVQKPGTGAIIGAAASPFP